MEKIAFKKWTTLITYSNSYRLRQIQYLAELWQNYTIGMDIYNHPVGYWIIFEN